MCHAELANPRHHPTHTRLSHGTRPSREAPVPAFFTCTCRLIDCAITPASARRVLGVLCSYGHVVVAYVVMAFVVMAYVVMAHVVMAYVVVACSAQRVLGAARPPLLGPCRSHPSPRATHPSTVMHGLHMHSLACTHARTSACVHTHRARKGYA